MPFRLGPTLQGDVETDVCVIGAGYTGLSSALFLLENGFRVTVLEAAKVGFGVVGPQWRADRQQLQPRYRCD